MASAGRRIDHEITHVIFDLDGVLLETEGLYSEANQAVLHAHGVEFTWELKSAMMGRRVNDAVKALLDKSGLQLTVDEYNKQYLPVLQRLFENCQFVPGAKKFAEHCKKLGYPLAVCTGSDKEQYDWKVAKHLEFFEQTFEHVVLTGSDAEVKEGKPAPDPYLVTMRRFKRAPVSPKNVFVLEDAPFGVQSAHAAGCTVMLINSSCPDVSSNPSAALADFHCKDFSEFDPTMIGMPPYDDQK